MWRRLLFLFLLWLFLFLLWLALLLLRLRLRPRRYLGLRPRLGLRLRPGLHLRLRARLGLRPGLYLRLRPGLRLRLHLGLRARLRPGLDLRLGLRPRLDPRRRLRFYLSRCLRLDLRRCLRLRLGLAGGAAALQPLVFYFLLPPLLRRQALVALGQGHAARLGGPGSSRRGCGPRGAGAGGASPRLEFSRFGPNGWRGAGLNLGRLGRGAGLGRSGSGVSPRLDLARLAGYDGLPRSRFAWRSGLSRLSRDAGFDLPRLHLPRSRLGRRRFERLRLRRLEPLLRRQLLNLLRHLGGQGHGGPGGQPRARQAPARL